jgi:rsbT co-antagonist protein RsbR
MTTPLAELQAENERLQQRVAELEQMLPEAEKSVDTQPQHTEHSPHIEIFGVPIEWQLDAGTCTFQGAAVATMFVNPTLAGLMSGFQKMVGTERFFLAMQSEGRKNIDIDWQIITSQPTFEQGFDAWSRFPILAGWGRWEIVSLDQKQKECRIRVHNSFEGLYQQALGVCWGSGVAAGKCAGIFSLLFETNCWAEQVEYLASGDTYDSFVIRPSERSLEEELDNLLSSDTATRADLAVALQQLQQEIEQRNQAETELRKNQEQLQFILEGSSDGAWDWNMATNEAMLSDRYREMLGYQPDELPNSVESWINNIHPDDLPAVNQHLQDYLEGRSDTYAIEHRLRHKSGEWCWMLTRGKIVVRDETGKPLRMTGTVSDITERKRAEEQLHIFKTLVENTLEGIVYATPDGIIRYSNYAYTVITGFGDQVVGSRIVDYYEPEDIPFVTEILLPAVIKEGKWQGVLRLRRPDGTNWMGHASVIPLYNSEGDLMLMAATFRDMTSQLQAEEERAALQQQIIDAQRDALRELSTPLIPVSDNVVIMPLIGTIDSGRAQQVMESLLEGVAHYQSELAILDITGVPVVDTQVAQALVSAARAVRLLGAQVMLTGIQPRIAQTLVQLGIDLSGISTRGSLQAGIITALKH